jgi:hypothetical protein
MSRHDPFAHLRANLDQYRALTSERTYTWWCTECQLHQADESGLCPLCRPDTPAACSDEPAA